MATAIEHIREEHKDLSCVLRALEMIVGGFHQHEGKADLELLASIIYYIQIFPDRMHHPKEETFLFKALLERRPDLTPIIDQLHDQHVASEVKIGRLAEAVRAVEEGSDIAFRELKRAAEDYVEFQFQHMQVEEDEILPAAEDSLTAEDWRDIDAAFAKNSDPMFGENLAAGFHALHDHIVNKIGF